MNFADIAHDWQVALAAERDKPYFAALRAFVDGERNSHTIYPPHDEVFTALRITGFNDVRVCIVGQDPYHDDAQAHGLAFSVRPGIKPPPSLTNIFKELRSDIRGFTTPSSGCLTPWAEQGVLLLNAVLTVRAHQANSHKGHGWETFTDAVIRSISERDKPAIFVLWGGYAGKKLPLIDTRRHIVVQSAHPSPLSAHNGFFGSRPFSRINAQLLEWGDREIDWQLPNLPTSRVGDAPR